MVNDTLLDEALVMVVDDSGGGGAVNAGFCREWSREKERRGNLVTRCLHLAVPR
jgi:hypothetical protein